MGWWGVETLTDILGTANCQLSNAKCITASVYPHSIQLLRFAVSPSNTLFTFPPPPIFPSLSSFFPSAPIPPPNPPNPRSLIPSLSTATHSSLIHSERSWNSSWASWCSREEKRELCFVGEWDDRDEIRSMGRREDWDWEGVFSSGGEIGLALDWGRGGRGGAYGVKGLGERRLLGRVRRALLL
jgi:hypothetical protein